MMPSEREAWDQQIGESSNQYHAFEHYRAMPVVGRSVRTAWIEHQQKCLKRILSKKPAHPPGWWTEISVRWGWVERAQICDRHQSKIRMEEEERGLRLMYRRKVAFAVQLQDKVLKALAMMDPAEVTAGVLPKWLEMAFKLEGEGRGIFEEARRLAEESTGSNAPPGTDYVEGVYVDLDQPILTDAERRSALDLAIKELEPPAADDDAVEGDDAGGTNLDALPHGGAQRNGTAEAHHPNER
jgi:hypothetical protein